MSNNNYLVSAIISVYNCERFIRGCLEDLEQQTIADKLEIVVVNSGSQQNEEPIIKEFQKKYDNIVYVKTEERETIYGAWNRGIKASSGKYITNANTDDRHRKDALEIMVNELENNKDIDLVYYDFIITDTENETFEKCTPVGYYNLEEFDKSQLITVPAFGHQPVWRRALHEEIGYFDETFKVAGDSDFWYRLCEKNKIKHIKQYLGLYLRNPKSLERTGLDIIEVELIKIREKYLRKTSHGKNRINAIKKLQSKDFFDVGYHYLKRGSPYLARKSFFRSVAYNWLNFKSYKCLISSLLYPWLIQISKNIGNKPNIKNGNS